MAYDSEMARKYVNILTAVGFIEEEAREFAYATTPSGELQDFDAIYNSVGFQKIVSERQSWIRRQKDKGLTGKQIEESIRLTYKIRKEESPHSLLKDEYRPSPKPRLDFNDGVRRMKQLDRQSRKYNYKS